MVGVGLPRLLDPSGECRSMLGEGAGLDEAERAGEGMDRVERGVEGRLSPGEMLVGRAGRGEGWRGVGVMVRECLTSSSSSSSSSSVYTPPNVSSAS